MTRWITLLLLFGYIFFAVHNLAPKIENDIQTRVVVILSEEGLSEVMTEVDGRNVLLSGPSSLLPEALDVVTTMVETHRISTRVTGNDHKYRNRDKNDIFTPVIHPDAIYWPPKLKLVKKY